jgi:hypothetical protein
MNDLLVRFTADVNSHCVGDIVRLTDEDKAETDAMAERFGIEEAYVPYEVEEEVTEADSPAQDTATEDTEQEAPETEDSAKADDSASTEETEPATEADNADKDELTEAAPVKTASKKKK